MLKSAGRFFFLQAIFKKCSGNSAQKRTKNDTHDRFFGPSPPPKNVLLSAAAAVLLLLRCCAAGGGRSLLLLLLQNDLASVDLLV
jgi:hypothetical protein